MTKALYTGFYDVLIIIAGSTGSTHREMEVLPTHPVLKLEWEEIAAMREECNMTDVVRIRDAIEHIRQWYRLQSHMLKKDLEPAFVERVLMLARGSVELAKKKIDAIATVRTFLPEFYQDRDVDSEEFQQIAKFICPVPLPTLCKIDRTRIIMIRMKSPSEPHVHFNALCFFKFMTLINETRMYFDYPAGDRYVLDLENFKLLDFTNFNISLIKKVQVITSAYGIKLKGIHFIKAPSYIDKAVFLLKQGLKDKMANRIHVHPSLEDLYTVVPKECMPEDYGGPHPSMCLLYDIWMDYLRSDTSQEYVQDANLLKTDESKRLGGKMDEEMMGIPGSFRTLSVD